eukprot:jgi/Chrzof1/8080/UNPLg00125.t1
MHRHPLRSHRGPLRCTDTQCGRIENHCGGIENHCGRIENHCGRIENRCTAQLTTASHGDPVYIITITDIKLLTVSYVCLSAPPRHSHICSCQRTTGTGAMHIYTTLTDSPEANWQLTK